MSSETNSSSGKPDADALESRFAASLARLRAGEEPDGPGWERLALVERLASEDADEGELVRKLLNGVPLPPFKLMEPLGTAVEAGNEGVALALVERGATLPVAEAARAGLPRLLEALIRAGGRLNRRFENELAPIHLAVAAPGESLAATRVLVEAGCDLNVRSPDRKTALDLAQELGRADVAALLEKGVGRYGPTWFRDAQTRRAGPIEVYRTSTIGLGFNPNDVQLPILSGGEAEGFGWPNSPEQGLEYFDATSELRYEVAWFRPFLEKLVAGEDFSLDEFNEASR